MSSQSSQISNAFQAFVTQAPEHAQAWSTMVQHISKASALDKKTSVLAYLSVLAALRLENGIPFHVQEAKRLGVSRQEVISAILIGLPAAGNCVTQVLPAALATFDSE